MSKSPKSYEEAYTELKAITEQLESDEIGIDELTKVVERAKILAKYCQDKLKTTEDSLKGAEE